MAKYLLSRRAVADIEAIAEYTMQRFGIDQARRYRDDLHSSFKQLADNPRMGRPAEQLSTGLRRLEHQSHVIFYNRTDEDVLIVRILHSRMDVPRQF